MFMNRESQQFTHLFRNNFQPNYCNPASIPQEVRKKIQNYSFLMTDKIGKGYSSIVYRGMNDITGQVVAIKVIELRSLRDQTSKHMLQTQIECFKQVKHKHLLRYQNSFFTVNNCYIITQYCSAGDLAKLIKENGGLSEDEVNRLFYQIYSGYSHFYHAGFIHRDIKPANIFLSQNKELRLADFGFSKRRTIIQKENYNVGTPIYMPRQSLTANIYNQKSDVWALGVTLYEMIFGYVPFRGKNQQELRNQIEKCCLVFPQSKPISQDLQNFITNCLLNDSFKRISVKQMQNHPWICRIKALYNKQDNIPKQIIAKQVEKNNAQQVTNIYQKEIRISVPCQGTFNKSKDYFEQKVLGNQNRRSISSMQKLKIYHPKKMSQIITSEKQPSVNRSVGSINLISAIPLKKQQSLRQNMISEASENKQNIPSNKISTSVTNISSRNVIKIKSTEKGKEKQKQKLQNKDLRLKNGIQKIVCLINYFRMLYKILQKINQASKDVFDPQIKAELSKFSNKILKELRNIFKLHQECLASKDNIFRLNAIFWEEFRSSDRWEMYSYVIMKYHKKYQNLLDNELSLNSKENVFDWSQYFVEFYDRLKDLQDLKFVLVRQKYILCQILYLFEKLVDMSSTIIHFGWQSFADRFQRADEIVCDGFTISMANYYQIDEVIKEKHKNIRMKFN